MFGELSPRRRLEIAQDHIERVLAAWTEPTDWSDLSLYGFYCLESAVAAASEQAGKNVERYHPKKAAAAKWLHDKFGLPDVTELLLDLNDARKAIAYGDVIFPDLDAEEVASRIEEYVDRSELSSMASQHHLEQVTPGVTERAAQALSCFAGWPSAVACQWLHRFVACAMNDKRIRVILGIGSGVRGARHDGSDIDLLVFHEGDISSFGRPPIDVDIRFYPLAEVEPLLASGHELLGWAARFGMLIHEKDGFWTRLLESWRGRVPFPSPDKARQRATRAREIAARLLVIGDEEAAYEQLVTMLTNDAWVRLLTAGEHPASRAELPDQLLGVGDHQLAGKLRMALSHPESALEAFRQELLRETHRKAALAVSRPKLPVVKYGHG